PPRLDGRPGRRPGRLPQNPRGAGGGGHGGSRARAAGSGCRPGRQAARARAGVVGLGRGVPSPGRGRCRGRGLLLPRVPACLPPFPARREGEGPPAPPSPPVAESQGTARLALSDPFVAVDLQVDNRPVSRANLASGLILTPGNHTLKATGTAFEPFESAFE